MFLPFVLQEAQEMQLLKFKSELSPPVVPSTELSQLIKISLHHPETYTHHFGQNRWDEFQCAHTHTRTQTATQQLSDPETAGKNNEPTCIYTHV